MTNKANTDIFFWKKILIEEWIMKLNLEEIKNKLTTKYLGRTIYYYEEINSTQDIVKENVNNYCNGSYIVTDKQTNGKGTHGRVWYDNGYENICGSFILFPNCNANKIKDITIIIAESMIETIKKLYDIELQIKYPNDIICNSKKIAGILTESSVKGEDVKSIVVGLGMNINQTEFSSEIEEIATSLKKEYKETYSREDIIAEFFNIFEPKYENLIK